MYYRMRTYNIPNVDIATSTTIFQSMVRPVHELLGARLVGRWLTDDRCLVVIWEYDSEKHCQDVLSSVKNDPELIRSTAMREASGTAAADRKEVFMRSTIEPESN